jgi:hypothetical protein
MLTGRTANPHLTGYLLLFLEFSVFYVFLLFYVAKILSYLNENAATVASFTTFACLLGIGFVDTLFPSLLKGSYADSLGILTQVVSVFVALRSFTVKNRFLSTPFKLFGIALFSSSFPRLLFILVVPLINQKLMTIYGQLTVVLILTSAFYVLKSATKYLKSDNGANIETATE